MQAAPAYRDEAAEAQWYFRKTRPGHSEGGEMKALCSAAGVAASKVFPHNLRHLFARTFYCLERDLSRLADILGHSSINTTCIYTAESGLHHARQMERMGLIIT